MQDLQLVFHRIAVHGHVGELLAQAHIDVAVVLAQVAHGTPGGWSEHGDERRVARVVVELALHASASHVRLLVHLRLVDRVVDGADRAEEAVAIASDGGAVYAQTTGDARVLLKEVPHLTRGRVGRAHNGLPGQFDDLSLRRVGGYHLAWVCQYGDDVVLGDGIGCEQAERFVIRAVHVREESPVSDIAHHGIERIGPWMLLGLLGLRIDLLQG